MKAYLCILHIITHSIHPPLAVTLIKPTTTIIYPFTDSSVTILDSIDNPLVVTLLIEYQGAPNTKHKHPVFLTPGEIFIQLDEDNDAYVDGPPLSHDFTAMLIQPMTHLSRRIAQLQTQLDSVQKKDGDFQKIKEDQKTIKDELAEAVRRREEIPRAYLEANPGLPLSLAELRQLSEDPVKDSPAPSPHHPSSRR
jgi:hypothetical protein